MLKFNSRSSVAVELARNTEFYWQSGEANPKIKHDLLARLSAVAKSTARLVKLKALIEENGYRTKKRIGLRQEGILSHDIGDGTAPFAGTRTRSTGYR